MGHPAGEEQGRSLSGDGGHKPKGTETHRKSEGVSGAQTLWVTMVPTTWGESAERREMTAQVWAVLQPLGLGVLGPKESPLLHGACSRSPSGPRTKLLGILSWSRRAASTGLQGCQEASKQQHVDLSKSRLLSPGPPDVEGEIFLTGEECASRGFCLCNAIL